MDKIKSEELLLNNSDINLSNLTEALAGLSNYTSQIIKEINGPALANVMAELVKSAKASMPEYTMAAANLMKAAVEAALPLQNDTFAKSAEANMNQFYKSLSESTQENHISISDLINEQQNIINHVFDDSPILKEYVDISADTVNGLPKSIITLSEDKMIKIGDRVQISFGFLLSIIATLITILGIFINKPSINNTTIENLNIFLIHQEDSEKNLDIDSITDSIDQMIPSDQDSSESLPDTESSGNSVLRKESE